MAAQNSPKQDKSLQTLLLRHNSTRALFKIRLYTTTAPKTKFLFQKSSQVYPTRATRATPKWETL